MKRLGLLLLALILFGAWSPPSAAQGLLLVANKADDTLFFIDARTLEVVDSTTTRRAPHEVAVTPDGEEVWVSARSGSVSIIDTETNEIIATLPAEGTPIRVEITPDGERARRLLDDSRHDCVEQGFLLVPVALQCLTKATLWAHIPPLVRRGRQPL